MSEPSTKPITTSAAVMPACHSNCSAPQMRAASVHTVLNRGSTNSGTPKAPGPHSQAARNNTNTIKLRLVVTRRSRWALMKVYFPATNWLVYRSFKGAALGTTPLST